MTETLISIVTGTLNRKPLLTQFLRSIRSQLPASIGYEIIIADAGSTDGTLEMLREQSDVVLIEEGERRGAIKAFTDAAYRARGKYVVMGNDDCELLPGSLLRAAAYLDEHLSCGGVAFAHDLPMRGLIDVYDGLKVALMPGRSAAGESVPVIYAQIGMFRKELGDAVGWWGGRDPVMLSGGGTYGADNFLSAGIWERGYTINAVRGVGNRDYANSLDPLRKDNRRAELETGFSAYYRRYPNGVPLPAQLATVDAAPLRVLYLPLNERGYNILRDTKRGLREALQRRFTVYEWDYVNRDEYDLPRNLAEIVYAFQPHLLLMQAHNAQDITPPELARARALCPHMLVVNWNGDVWEAGHLAPAVLALLEHVDLQLTVNASTIPEYQKRGIKAAYWQYSYETIDGDLPDVPAHDVLFLGNAYSKERKALGALLRSLESEGINVGLYGRGWDKADGETLYDYRTGAALIRKAKIVIGDSQFPNARGFFSNRVWETLGNGGFLLHQRVDGLEELTGLGHGKHYVEWEDLDHLASRLTAWLNPNMATSRRAIAQVGERYVRDCHSFDARVQELGEIIQRELYDPT